MPQHAKRRVAIGAIKEACIVNHDHMVSDGMVENVPNLVEDWSHLRAVGRNAARIVCIKPEQAGFVQLLQDVGNLPPAVAVQDADMRIGLEAPRCALKQIVVQLNGKQLPEAVPLGIGHVPEQRARLDEDLWPEVAHTTCNQAALEQMRCPIEPACHPFQPFDAIVQPVIQIVCGGASDQRFQL
ncbi:MAG: hypothetical protein IT510_05670 [Sulfuritalea sp.]|nr:hypothetical protein [Sulfuritalea sp.]